MTNKKPLSDFIYDGILDDEDLIAQFERLHCAYLALVFDATSTAFDSDFELLLRYADLLSLSKEERHKNIAQQIVIMMSQVFPDLQAAKIYKDSVYKNVSNFANLELVKNNGNEPEAEFEFLRELSFCVHREQNRADGTDATNSIYLFDTQKSLLHEIGNNQFFSFSAPTSMGKTFVILNHIKNLIRRGAKENFAIVVPTRALINEIADKIIREFKDILNPMGYNVVTTTEAVKEKNFIAVLTPENGLHEVVRHTLNYYERHGRSFMNRNISQLPIPYNGFYQYNFSKVICKKYPLKDKCKISKKSRSFSITLPKQIHQDQLDFQKTEYFKNRYRQRYKIEAKNSEAKNCHGLDTADSKGIHAMNVQSYLTAFVLNIKRIFKLHTLKTKNGA